MLMILINITNIDKIIQFIECQGQKVKAQGQMSNQDKKQEKSITKSTDTYMLMILTHITNINKNKIAQGDVNIFSHLTFFSFIYMLVIDLTKTLSSNRLNIIKFVFYGPNLQKWILCLPDSKKCLFSP